MAPTKKIRVTLLKSRIGRLPKQKACLDGLGLKKVNQTVELLDTKEIRGMINKVDFMVRVDL